MVGEVNAGGDDESSEEDAVEGEARRVWFCLETKNDRGDIIFSGPL